MLEEIAMPTFIAREKFLAKILISLATVMALGRVTEAGQASGKPPAGHMQSIAGTPKRGKQYERQLQMTNPGPGNRQYKMRTLSAGELTTSIFLPTVTFDAGGIEASSVAVADVNDDGKPDIVVANYCGHDCTEGRVDVLLGNGDGTFKAPVGYPSGGSIPYSVAVADVNGDGKPDIVVANCASIGLNVCDVHNSLLGILVGHGDGTFQAVNGDGKLDLVATICPDACRTSGGVAILLGNSVGTFQQPAVYATAYDVEWVEVADVNGDGILDLLVASAGNNRVGVLLGKGDGTFRSPVFYDQIGGISATAVRVADVNDDGNPDLLVANACSDIHCTNGSVGVLFGNGDGTFHSAVSYKAASPGARSLAVADVNGDQAADLIVANYYSKTVSVLLANGDGTFQSAITYPSGGYAPTSLAVADVNKDGPPDVVVANLCITSSNCSGNSPIGVLLNNSGVKSPTSTSLASSLNPSTYGQKVTWTATVTSTGSVTPTGTIKFTWSGNAIGSATLNSSGVATLTKSNLNADSYPLAAVYVGDAANLGSTSAVLNQVVLQTTTSATLTSSPNLSAQGQAVAFTATISSPTVAPTGPVTFSVGKTVLGTAQLSGGKAKFTISTLVVGSTKVTATYYGNSNIAKSSASVTQTVHQ
jgi:hypothetical protein